MGDDTNLVELKFNILAKNISVQDISAQSFKLYDISANLLSDHNNTDAKFTIDAKEISSDIKIVSGKDNPLHGSSYLDLSGKVEESSDGNTDDESRKEDESGSEAIHKKTDQSTKTKWIAISITILVVCFGSICFFNHNSTTRKRSTK